MTEVTRLAAAALAVQESIERLGGPSPEIGLLVRVPPSEKAEESFIRTVERVLADVSKRYGVPVEPRFDRYYGG